MYISVTSSSHLINFIHTTLRKYNFLPDVWNCNQSSYYFLLLLSLCVSYSIKPRLPCLVPLYKSVVTLDLVGTRFTKSSGTLALGSVNPVHTSHHVIHTYIIHTEHAHSPWTERMKLFIFSIINEGTENCSSLVTQLDTSGLVLHTHTHTQSKQTLYHFPNQLLFSGMNCDKYNVNEQPLLTHTHTHTHTHILA